MYTYILIFVTLIKKRSRISEGVHGKFWEEEKVERQERRCGFLYEVLKSKVLNKTENYRNKQFIDLKKRQQTGRCL